jgi:hypothetical protein
MMNFNQVHRKLLFGVSFLTLFFSCSDIIETDISNKEMTIMAPVDRLISQNTSIIFLWDKLEGGRKYEFQIVAPSFDSTSFVAIDTLLVGNKFAKVLPAGNYQWRVRAVNNGYQSRFSIRSFKIK